MATIINGKEYLQKIKSNVAEEVKQLKDKGIHPGLAVVIVGEDPASKNIRKKQKACMSGSWNSFGRIRVTGRDHARRIIGFGTQTKRKTRYRRYFGAVSFAKRSGRTIGD